jgi:tripartite-type tricarboxylate transporter receptor subunit TctC
MSYIPNFTRRRLALGAAGCLLPSLVPQVAMAQSWPSKPLRIVVPFPAGGALDVLARSIAESLARRLGQPVLVENKPGASTIIGLDFVAKSGSEGYAMVLAGLGSFSVLPALRKGLPFDVEKDFAFIALVAYSPVIVVSPATKPFRTLPDLISAAKAKPGGLRYGTYGDGSANHLTAALLATVAGIDVEPIPYKGSSEIKIALLRGDLDFSFETLANVGSEMQSGTLRALAHGGPGRSALQPDLPGLAEFGYGKAAVQAYFGLAIPASTPEAVRNRLTKEVQEIMSLPDMKGKAAANFMESAALGPTEMQAIVRRDTATFKQLAQQLKISLN